MNMSSPFCPVMLKQIYRGMQIYADKDRHGTNIDKMQIMIEVTDKFKIQVKINSYRQLQSRQIQTRYGQIQTKYTKMLQICSKFSGEQLHIQTAIEDRYVYIYRYR